MQLHYFNKMNFPYTMKLPMLLLRGHRFGIATVNTVIVLFTRDLFLPRRVGAWSHMYVGECMSLCGFVEPRDIRGYLLGSVYLLC